MKIIKEYGYFYSFKNFLQDTFGTKVYKITIDAGFTCPNRKEGKGCLYCDANGSGNALYKQGYSIEEQIEKGIKFLKKRYKAKKFIAYFQAYSNTYDTVNNLKKKYDVIKKYEDIVGLSIGTRPDCIDEKKLELISSYTKDYQVWLELGMQTSNDAVLKFINRGHNWKIAIDALKLANKYPLLICLHFIIGLPHDKFEFVLRGIKECLKVGFKGIKLHNLYITKDAPLYELFIKGKINLISYEEYLNDVCDVIEILPQDIVIQRLIGEGQRNKLVAPLWSLKKSKFLQDVKNELIKRKSYQGKKFYKFVK